MLSTAAAQDETDSACLEDMDKSPLRLQLHKVCTDALLLISPAGSADSACQSPKEAHYFAAVAKVVKALLDLLHADSNCSQYVLDLVHGSDRMADTWKETNSYTRTMHTSANKTFWEMTTGDVEGIKYIADQGLTKKNVAADGDAKRKML